MATMARSPLLAVLAIGLVVTTPSCGTCPPAPSVASISPSSATAGSSQLLLTVNGNDFRRYSLVVWNGSYQVTSFVSSHQLLAVIPAADIAQPGTALVFVFNPPEGSTTFGGTWVMSTVPSTTGCSGKTSNAVSFTINK
jgi:hypothetical protein